MEAEQETLTFNHTFINTGHSLDTQWCLLFSAPVFYFHLCDISYSTATFFVLVKVLILTIGPIFPKLHG